MHVCHEEGVLDFRNYIRLTNEILYGAEKSKDKVPSKE